MIRERANPESKWAAYLQALPKETDAPVFWSNEELTDLEGTQLAYQVCKRDPLLKTKHTATVV